MIFISTRGDPTQIKTKLDPNENQQGIWSKIIALK